MRRVRLAELLDSPAETATFAALIAGGGVAAIPTETFYGLAADPLDAGAIHRIFAAKGRGDDKPLPVVFANRSQLARLGVFAADTVLSRYEALWPAPLSVVLPLSNPIPASLGRSNLAIRIPGCPDLVRLLEAVGPLTATSANVSGEPPLADPDEVARTFETVIDWLVDGGKTPGGTPSTIVDATEDPPRLLRAGAHSWPC